MAADETVRARIDGRVKEDAVAVLESMGLTPSDAIRMMFVRIAAEKALPFDVRVPNAQTRAAMAELDRGKSESFNSVDDLMADLNADD